MSPQTGTPAAAAAASNGWLGRQPGEVTTSSTLSGSWSAFTEHDLDAETAQLGGERVLPFAVAHVDRHDPGPARGERPGRGRPRHAQARARRPGPRARSSTRPETHSA